MVKKIMRSADGHYHIKGKKYEILIGSRAQVEHETAYKTPGGLTRDKLFVTKHGRIVSRKKHLSAKKDRRLEKAGYFTKKGKFGYVRREGSSTRKGRRKNELFYTGV